MVSCVLWYIIARFAPRPLSACLAKNFPCNRFVLILKKVIHLMTAT